MYYGILLFFVLEYVRPGSYVPAFNALHLNSIVPFGVFLGSLLRTNTKVSTAEVLRSYNAKWLMFFLGLIVLSAFTCDVKMYVSDFFTMVLSYCFMYFFLRKEVYDIPRMVGIFQILIVVNVVVGLLTPDMFSGDGQRYYIASGAFLGDGNDFALSVNIAIPMCLFIMLESKKWIVKAFYGGILSIMIFAIVATQSRGGILALSAVVLYLWGKSDRKLVGIIGIALVVGFIFAVAPPQFFDRMATMTQTGENMEGSAAGRIEAWKAGVRMALDHPLTGVGAGHFPVKYGVEYRPEGVGPSGIPWQTAHSNYFVILGELGFPGIIFLLAVLIGNYRAMEKLHSKIRGHGSHASRSLQRLTLMLNASLISFIIGGAFLTSIRYPHLYLLAALLESARFIYTQQTVEKPTVSMVPNSSLKLSGAAGANIMFRRSET